MMDKIKGAMSTLADKMEPDPSNPNYENKKAADEWAAKNLPDPGSIRTSPSKNELFQRDLKVRMKTMLGVDV